ncbi:exodeoxyribonuclease III [Leptolyngbya sp. FACHB-321]|uniref:exodeoxyribonuclease III n=1 Tax=Leptolyngbya sp. FACHB-321 TaxID=2692807 RepID=UPI001688C0CB|nr:exodeoxyribonuclease III [Leptolyngbya sp. FACHB-321]MBD2033977.1 exodeoxyribonuclease III [Leptolyngbya sp. FACHB-321]
MKVATWNVNSIRTRLNHIVNWLQENPVDVLCLQETKVMDESFPHQPFADLGYHTYISGQKSYNGVAMLSREPLSNVSTGFAPLLGEAAIDLDGQKRVIAGTLDGIRIVNLYVPNGSSVGSEKYAYKLRWLAALRDYVQRLRDLGGKGVEEETSPAPPLPSSLLLCGDFNIALDDIDIHDPTGREKMVMATDLERQALQAVLALGFADVFRKFTTEGGNFSWWDYRSAAFRRNLGWRIDHIYLTPALYERAIACTIDASPRKLEQPSDHTPVWVEL